VYVLRNNTANSAAFIAPNIGIRNIEGSGRGIFENVIPAFAWWE
jgi:hypothetical protein